MDEIVKSYYGISPANVRYDNSLAPNAKLLYIEFTALSNEKGYCWATNKYFADLYHVSIRSISTWINQLKKSGHIKVDIIYRENTKEVKARHIYIANPIEEKFHTSPQNVPYPIEEKFPGNSISINNINYKEEKPLLKLLPTQQETNSTFYIENTLHSLELYYKNAVIAICNANDDPMPSKYSDFKNDLRAWKKLEPTPELVETIKTHFENIALSARRAERFKEWQTWEVFFKDSEDWDDSDEIKERMKRNIFIPYIKRFDRYLADRDWLNVYLKLQEPFWFYMTPVMVEPLQKDLAKAGIKMELIKDLDYEIATRKELKQKSFLK